MKLIQGLRKSLLQEFGTQQILKWSQSLFKKSKPHSFADITQYMMNLDKPRMAAGYNPDHQLIQAMLAENLEAKLSSQWAKSLVSYQRGKSAENIFSDLKLFLQDYKKSQPLKKNRKLKVFRWDIHKYSESIPFHANSRLWSQLKKSGLEHLVPWIHAEVCGRVIESHKETVAPFTVVRGLSFSSPINPPLVNLYLSDFDHDFETKFPTVFYRRFCDDCLIVGEDQKMALKAKQWVEKELTKLELKVHPNKSLFFDWSGSGFESKVCFEYLGRSIHFGGNVFLSDKKRERIFQEWIRVMKLVRTYDSSVLVSTWENFLKTPELVELFTWVDDAHQVKNLSDRLGQLTRHNFPHIKDIPSLYSCWVKKFK